MKKLFLFNKWDSISDAVKSSIALTISSFIIKGIGFITTPIFTRIMDQAHYGILSKYNSWITIIDVFALLGLTSAGVFNVGLNEYSNRRNQYISSVLTLCNITTLAIFSIIFLVKAIFYNDFLFPYSLLIAMLVHFLFSPAMIFWTTWQKYEYKYKAVFLVTIFSYLISQSVSILAVIYLDYNPVDIRIWSSTITVLVFQIPIYILIYIKGRTFINKEIWKKILVFAVPLLPHYLAQHVMSGSDKIMIAELYSEAAGGIYSVVSNLSLISTVIWNSVNASLIPYSFEKLNEKKYKELSNVVVLILSLYGLTCFGISLVAPEVIAFLAPKEYYVGIYAVPPIVCVSFMAALYNIYANIEFYHKKSRRIASATVVSALSNIILNCLFIPKFGFIAAAYTTFVSNTILILMHYYGYRKCQNGFIYDDKSIFLITILNIVLCMLCNLLYLNHIIRYITIIAIIVIVIINRKRVLKILHDIKPLK